MATLAQPAFPGLRPITPKEFALFQGLVFREAGIYLSEAKKALLVGRLARRLRELGLHSYGEYYRCVVEGGDAERTRMLNAICTNETHFFREPRQFEFLEREALPRWRAEAAAGRRAKRIRAWSAGCSTGEEPYSMAMTLLTHCPPSAGWQTEILATDLSTKVLDQARAGIWPLGKAAEIPGPYLKAFMLKGQRSQEGLMRVGPEIEAMVRFQHANLNDDACPVTGAFDLILCRNVLIYFNTASKTRVVRRLLERLAPGGYLFVGHAESLNAVASGLQSVIPTVYTRAADAAARSRGAAR